MLLESRIPFGYIAKKARREFFIVLCISTIVEIILYYQREYLPAIPGSLPAFLGTAISLLLSFKLNQSYDRWWEARKVWGAIVNDSRTLVRQLSSFAAADPESVRRMAHRQIAWCYALGQSLRRLDWKVRAVAHLSEADVAECSRHQNAPLALIALHARDLSALAEAGHLTDYQRIAIDDTLTRLVDSQGKAERIRGTVFPSTYRIFLHAFTYIFITLLAVALAEVEGIWQISITMCVAIPFFLLEKSALYMQDPFANRPTDTAMTTIARMIDINIRQLLGEEDLPPPLEDLGFYVM
jgi:ion channel-forming bestrophin family protein